MLMQNYSLYSDMLDCISRGEADIIIVCDELVLLYQTKAEIYYVAPFSNVGLNMAIDYLINHDRQLVVLHGERYFDEYKARMGVTHDVPCYQATFPVRQSTVGLREDVEIRPIGEEWTDFVTTHYSRSGGNSDYCRNRLVEGKMFGAFVDGTLAGFVGQHDENAIGLLEVLPVFSGKGIGKKLEVFMINRILDEGYVPYCHVVVGEDRAYAFHMKREGVIMSEDKLTWTR